MILEFLTRLDMRETYFKRTPEVYQAKEEYIVQLEKQNAQLLESHRRLIEMREKEHEKWCK